MGIATFSVSRVIDASVAEVWRLLEDTRMWPRWGPSVSAVSLNEETIQKGSRGRVKVLGLIWLPFEVTYCDPGRYWAWRVGGIPATGHRVSAVGSRQCRLDFEVPLWAAPYTLICLMAIKRIQRITARYQP